MLNIRGILNSQHNAKRMPFWCLKPILWEIFFNEKTIFCSPKNSVKNSHWVKTRFRKKKGVPGNVFWASNRDFENKSFWEWGVRICGEAVLFDFRCVFARTYFKLRYCGFAKLLKKISVNFNGVCGFLILVCAVFVRISVQFCAESHAPSPPLRTPLLSFKFTLLNHYDNFRFSAIQTIYSLQTCCGISKLFSSAIRTSSQTAVSKLFSV